MTGLKLPLPKIWKAFLYLVIFSFSINAEATNWYVNKSGNDTLNGNAPTFVSGYLGPKLTINSVLAVASDGDTLNIGSGYYNESLIITVGLFINFDTVGLHAVEINASASHVILSGDTLEVRDSLTLTAGFIDVSNDTTVFFCPHFAKVSTGSAVSFITGRFYRRTETGIGSMYFPVGVNQDFRPFTVDFHQLVADTRLHFIQAFADSARSIDPLPSPIRNISTRHYWQFGRIGSGQSTDYIFTPSYDSVYMDDQVFDPSSLQVMFSWYTGNWVGLGGSGNAPRLGEARAGISVDTVGLITLGNIYGGLNPLGSEAPFASYSNTGLCNVGNFVFKNQSLLMSPGQLALRLWDFGDTTVTTDTSSIKNPTYKYTKAGTYKVKLLLVNTNGDRDSVVQSVIVKSTPKAFIENGNVCFSAFSRFKDTSTLLGPDTLVSRTWNLGDGTVAQGKSIIYTYGAAGTYSIKLTVVSSSGCVDSMVRNTTVYPKPSPSFITSSKCSGDSFKFKRIQSLSPPDNLITYTWYDNYKLGKTDTVFSTVLGADGNHRITLRGVSNFGCVDSVVSNATVYGLPQLNIDLDKAIAHNDSIQCFTTNQFTLSASGAVGQGQSIAFANWKWGDGISTVSTDSVHSYATQGVFRITYVATTDKGCIDSVSKNYVVRGLVSPNFGKIGLCAPDSITFYDSASSSTSAITSYLWKFPGGTELVGQSVRHWNKPTGPITVELITTNAEGCMDSISRSFTFTQYPVINWLIAGSMPFCKGDSIGVQADGGLKMLWLLDNDTNRNRFFKTAGNYKVKASNSAACYSIDSFQVVLYPDPVISVYSDTTIYRGTSAILRAKGGVSYKWSPSTYLNDTTGAMVISTPSVDSIEYMLTGTASTGCKDSKKVKVLVVDKPVIRIPNIITPNGDGENDYWVLSELRDLDRYDLTITNYAGKVVFQTSNYKNNWNAMEDGKQLAEGVFYYHLKNRRTAEVFKGFIQVIR